MIGGVGRQSQMIGGSRGGANWWAWSVGGATGRVYGVSVSPYTCISCGEGETMAAPSRATLTINSSSPSSLSQLL